MVARGGTRTRGKVASAADPGMPLRAAVYIRVSSAEQVQGHSLESQRDACVAFVEQQGGEVVEVFEDGGFSATSTDRPAFQRMLAEAGEGRFNAIVTLRHDRFARSLEDSVVIRRQLGRRGVRVLSATEPIDLDSPMAPVIEALYAGIAEWYSRDLKAKVTRGLRKRAEKGLMNAMPPFGYRQAEDPTHEPPIVVLEEADAVRWAYEAFASGRKMIDIAEELNRRGFRTRYRARRGADDQDGRLWTSQSVSALLANPVYTGVITYRGEIVGPGQHEAIVSEELFRHVERLRSSARGRKAAPERDLYLLRGIAKCSGCGSNLQGNHSRSGMRYRYYRETARRRGMQCEAPQSSVRADWLEGEIDALVARFRMPDDVRDRVLELVQGDGDDDDREARAARVEEQLRRLRRLYADLAIDESEYDARRRSLEAEQDRLMVPAVQATQAAETFDVLQRAWATATHAEKRTLALTLFEAVYVDVGAKTIAEVVIAPAFRPWLVEESR